MNDHQHSHDHDHDSHEHGHSHDQGLKGMLRYLRHAPQMWRSEVNDAVVARLAPQTGETVMDIGAGFGAGTVAALKHGASVVAVEPTPYMRRILGVRRAIGRTGDRVRIVDGTAEYTKVNATSIDAAWAVNTMHHWSSMDEGIGELDRVLVSGGRFLLVDEDFDDPTHPDFESFAETRAEHSHHFETVDPDVVAAECAKAGLSITFAGRDHIADRPAIVIEGIKS